MAKKYNWRSIKTHYSYKTKEAARALKCSEATIRNWIKEGLPIYKDRKPLLIEGADLRQFVRDKTQALKWALPSTNAPWTYFPCFKCKDYRRPYLLMVDAHKRKPNAIDLSGICEHCEREIRKTVTPGQLPQIETGLDITYRKGDGT